jgi:hypothetical protein
MERLRGLHGCKGLYGAVIARLVLRAAEWWKAGSQPVVALFMGYIADAGARLWGQMLARGCSLAGCRLSNHGLHVVSLEDW